MLTKKRPPPVPRDLPGRVQSFIPRTTVAKERLVSERDGVIVAEKRQWPHAGTSLGTGGGLFFVSITLLEAFFDGGLISIDNGHLCWPFKNISYLKGYDPDTIMCGDRRRLLREDRRRLLRGGY